MQAQEYDVLIIGSGASGGMAAYTLTRLGVKCLMLEAGPPQTERTFETKPVHELPFRGFGDPGKVPHVFQANEGNENQWANERDHPYTHDPGHEYNWVRVRMVGGKSNYWARMSFRLSDYEFRAKDFDGYGDNWPLDHAELSPYYERAEPIFRVTGRTEGFSQLPDGVFIERPRGTEGEAARKVIAAAAARDIPNTLTRSSSGQNGSASSANLLIPPAMETGNLAIVSNAVVRDVTVDPATGLANGANFVDRNTRREHHASARVVVMGASCLESTRILLNSGIANSSGVLGRYLHDQFYITNAIWAVMPEVMDGSAPEEYTQGGGGYMPRFRNLRPNENHDFIRGYALQWSVGGSPGRQYFGGYGDALEREVERHRGSGFTATAMGEVLPRYNNRVTISPDVTDAWGIPALHFDCRYTDNEFNMARDAVNVLEELADDCGWEVITRRPEMFPPGYSIHELGTCRMGEDPRTSVLNRWNQSHDVRNLFVVDGSSFVTGGSQNPTMTILALSMRASEYLAEQMRTGEI
jgi:choline dehydrogenase-like flavoprotein